MAVKGVAMAKDRMRAGIVIAGVAAMALGCSQSPSAPASLIEDKPYPVTPTSVTVKVGIMTGAITDLKITERVEQGSGRVVSPAKLTGTLKLKNTSVDQSVRLVSWRIRYIDGQGRPIAMADGQQVPTIKFAGYAAEGLDPGQEGTHSVEAEVPAEALKPKALRGIRLELTYLPSAYKEEKFSFPISIGSP